MNDTERMLKLIKSAARGGTVYVVGGWLRDRFLGRANRDLDVVFPGDPIRTAKSFAAKTGGSFVLLDRRNKIYRVVLKGRGELEYVDFAKMKAPLIRDDLLKRDFTINSMAAEIKGSGRLDLKKVLDPSGGKTDLKNRAVRMTSPASFVDDPLRMLRAVRIASELGFTLKPGTLKMLSSGSASILKSASERVRDELVKTLRSAGSSRWIAALEKSGVLERLIPEISPMKKSARKFYFHPNGLWQHAQETLSSFEDIIANLGKYFPDTHAAIESHLNTPLSRGVDRRIVLKLTALLHDCAKPFCAKRFGQKTRFLGHEKKGAALIGKIFRRLKMSSKEIKIAANVTANHMRPVSLSQTGTVSQRASFRLFRDMGDNTPDLLLLALADWHSYKRLKTNKPANLKKQEAVLKELVTRYFAQKTRQIAPKLIDGNIIMKKLSLEPGPIIGRLLKEVSEAQAVGTISTAGEALALAGARLTKLAKKYRITTNN